MSEDLSFTGERLHDDDPLFGVDLARHRAAYEIAGRRQGARTLDLGCGSGYGAASLVGPDAVVVGVDRVPPDRSNRGGAHFVRADLGALPLAAGHFDLVVSFQVIEHMENPGPYLDAIAAALAPGGTALLTTPNVLMSDGVNPYHVHEYEADELAALLHTRFDRVVVEGIGATDAVHRHLEARSRRIHRIVRLDPLRLRERLPRPLIEWLFARFAVLVRRQGAGDDSLNEIDWRDFPIGPADARCLDLLATCRRPRAAGPRPARAL